jgi:acyl carrier protein
LQPSPAAIAERLESYVRNRFQVAASDSRFGRNVNLWEHGYVDSTGVVEVIAFLESTYHVNLPEEVLFSPDFTSIDGMARLVSGLLTA